MKRANGRSPQAKKAPTKSARKSRKTAAAVSREASAAKLAAIIDTAVATDLDPGHWGRGVTLKTIYRMIIRGMGKEFGRRVLGARDNRERMKALANQLENAAIESGFGSVIEEMTSDALNRATLTFVAGALKPDPTTIPFGRLILEADREEPPATSKKAKKAARRA